MDKKLLHNTYKEYIEKRETIFERYGEKDRFIISGTPWWEYYPGKINRIIGLYRAGDLSEVDAREFYMDFGFAPKTYVDSFIENGLPAIGGTFHYLVNPNIDVKDKIYEVVENPGGEYNLRGAGLNFVTLFLTVIFPEEYGQFNSPIEEALKILDVLPEMERGAKISQKYYETNQVLLEISKEINEPFLPHIDNYLFSLSKGYIGGDIGVSEIIERNVDALEKTSEDTEIEPADRKKYLEIQYKLIVIGKEKGYNVWVASNDRNEEYEGNRFSELALDNIPIFGAQRAVKIAKWIDLIWFNKGTHTPVRFIEIEHSTSIYSGLLRMNDVLVDYPIPKATIVIPEGRLKKTINEMSRPTFNDLSEVCDVLTYEDIREWYKAIDAAKKFD